MLILFILCRYFALGLDENTEKSFYIYDWPASVVNSWPQKIQVLEASFYSKGVPG